ncbi:hypothetical protein IE81DRAFT_347777 [Ceraceosorus guamensis]|uniref:Uncharacterized protein n=1 Tax=Ceraceosorus guamensis TaxID=1522189 RepID=A0A316W0G1_9BASI|nr:hypothetical protein IE81DRAFT_347777 [Ceraceosorus guamensis]PWN42051.1 hypothetical protein IE81DRAFT_347777 [Ceraceosorus guamensis]
MAVRTYAQGPVGGAHPPPEQGGSRSTGTTRMLGLSIATLAVGIGGFFLLSKDTRKAAVSASGQPTVSKISGSKDRAAQILKQESDAAQSELKNVEQKAAGAVKEVGEEIKQAGQQVKSKLS